MKFLRWLALLLLLVVMGGGYVAYRLSQPYAAFESETFVDFAKGTTTMEMAHLLERAGVIAHAWEFLTVRALEPKRALKAGEYQFNKPASAFEVYDRIDSKPLTSKLCYPFSDLFLVQWDEQQKLYPKSQVIGRLF